MLSLFLARQILFDAGLDAYRCLIRELICNRAVLSVVATSPYKHQSALANYLNWHSPCLESVSRRTVCQIVDPLRICANIRTVPCT